MHGDLAFHASRVVRVIYLATTFGTVGNKSFTDKPQAKICALILLPNVAFFLPKVEMSELTVQNLRLILRLN